MVFINYYHLKKMVRRLLLFSFFATKETHITMIIDDLLIFVRLYNCRYESLLYYGHLLFPQQQSFRMKNKILPNFIKNLYNFFFCIEKCLNEIAIQMKISVSSSTTFIVHQAVPTHNQNHQYELIKASSYELPLNQVLDPCLSGTSIIIQIIDVNQSNDDYPLTTVEDYFR